MKSKQERTNQKKEKEKEETETEETEETGNLNSPTMPLIDRFASILSSPITSSSSTSPPTPPITQHNQQPQQQPQQYHSNSTQTSIFIPEMTHYTDTDDDEQQELSNQPSQPSQQFGLAFKPEEVANLTSRSHSRSHSRQFQNNNNNKLPRGLSPPFSPTTPSPIIENNNHHHHHHLNQFLQSNQIINSIQSLNHHHHHKKPPPVSIPPPLRRPIINQSISSILSQHQSATDHHHHNNNNSGKELEIEEQLDVNRRTGRHETLAIRIDGTGKVDGEGGRDRWGNRWSMEGHVLSPVISERTEPTHTTTGGTTHYSSSVTSSNHSNSSQPSSSLARLVSNNTLLRRLHHSNIPFTPTQSHSLLPQNNESHQTNSSNRYSSPIPARPFSTIPNNNNNNSTRISLENQQESVAQALLQPSESEHDSKKIKKSKLKRLSDKKDYEIATRQAQKRSEKERREKMVKMRDEIVKQLIQSPSNAGLIRDLGKLYLDWNQGNHNSSEPSIKLAIHYLEQSIQIDNGDPMAWNVLAKAWQTLHFQHPTTTQSETNQRISNASLGYRKSVMLSTPSLPISNEYRKDYQKFLALKKRYREAALVLQEGIELNPVDPSLWFELGKMMKCWSMESNSNDQESNLASQKERLGRAYEAFERSFELDCQDETQLELNEIKRIQEEIKEREVKKNEDWKAKETEGKGGGGMKFNPEMMVIPDFESLMRQKVDRENNEKIKVKETTKDCKVDEEIDRTDRNCDQTDKVLEQRSVTLDEEKLKKSEQADVDVENERMETPKQELNTKLNALNVNDHKQEEVKSEKSTQVGIEHQVSVEVDKKKKWDQSEQLKSMDRSVWNAPEPSQLSPPAFNLIQARTSRSTVNTLNRYLSPTEDEKVLSQSMQLNNLDQTRSPTPKARPPTRSSNRQPPSPSALPTPNTHPRNSVGTITPKTNQLMSPRSSRAASIRSESSATGSAEGEKKSSQVSRHSSTSQVKADRSDSNPSLRFQSNSSSLPTNSQFRSPPSIHSQVHHHQFDPNLLSPLRPSSRFDHHPVPQQIPSSARTSQSRRGDRASCCLPSISKPSFQQHRTSSSVDQPKISPRSSSVDRSLIESIPPPRIPPRPLSQADRVGQFPYLIPTPPVPLQTPNRPNSSRTRESLGGSRRRNGLNDSCRVSEDWLGGSTAVEEDMEEEESFALINAHLQSIQEIDRLRREEIITLRRRFEDNEMNAERKRSEVIDNLRKICSRTCTPRPKSGIGSRRSCSVVPVAGVEKSADCALNGIASILQLLQQQQQQQAHTQQQTPQQQAQ